MNKQRTHIRVLLAIVIAVLAAACQKQDKVDSIVTGNPVVKKNLTLNSVEMGQQMNYSILLPGSYNTNTDAYYPVLYLLHGMGDDNNAWLEKGDAKSIFQQAVSNEVLPEMIVVMPDALVTFYVNDYQDELQYENYFQEEFIPFIESEYRIKADRENRFIAGLSMGGYGASYHAFTYPGMFTYCYSMSGALEGVGSPATPAISSILAELSSDFQSLPQYTMDCGMQDYLVFEANENTHSQLTGLGFSHEYIERAGTHDWTFWKEALTMLLERIGRIINENNV